MAGAQETRRRPAGTGPKSDFALRLAIDRQTSKGEIKSGFYIHADRSLVMYEAFAPMLTPVLSQLTRAKSQVRGLDIGCGTGRAAAEIMAKYPSVDMTGITLVYHPPVDSNAHLPRERIRITCASRSGLPAEGYDLVLAVGSFDTSNTFEYEGKTALSLVAKGGYFFFVPMVMSSVRDELPAFMDYAAGQGFIMREDENMAGKPYYVFKNGR